MPMSCRATTSENSCVGVMRSTSRPTTICPSAPQRKTAVARPPTASSEMLAPSRSSTILGSAIDSVLKVRPLQIEITI